MAGCILVTIFFVDPMNALQNLTGGPPTGAPGMGMASRAQGAPMSGMSGLGPMGQQMSLPGQQPPPGTSGMAPHGMPGVSTATQQSKWSLASTTEIVRSAFQYITIFHEERVLKRFHTSG